MDEATRDVPPGMWRCPGCEQVRDINDMHPMSADPYGSPGCGACLEEMYPQLAEGGAMPEETEDIWNLYDLTLKSEGRPGDIVYVRVRSRSVVNARSMAATVAGREGRDAWHDPARAKCCDFGRAHVQWGGVVTLRAYGAIEEEIVANHTIGKTPLDDLPAKHRWSRTSDFVAEHHRDQQPRHTPIVDPDVPHGSDDTSQ